jgi:Ca2+-binding RTX toxin-like protein
VTGTTGDDTINAPLAGAAGATATYSPADQISGGAGTDTLYVETNGNLSLATQTGLEVIRVNAVGGDSVVTLSNDAAYTKLESVNSANNVTFNAVKNATASVAMTAVANGKSTTIAYTDTALAGASDNLAVALNSTDGTLAVTGGTAGNVLETVTINTVATSAIDGINLGSANTTKLVFTGAGDLNAGTITDNASTLKSYDASAMTGALTLTVAGNLSNTVSGGAGDDNITGGSGNDIITGGAGNDTVAAGTGIDNVDLGAGNDVYATAGSSITKDDVISGGAGTDILLLSGGITYNETTAESAGVGVTGFEVLASNGTVTQDGRALSGITSVVANSADTVTLTKDSSIAAVTFKGNGTVSMESAGKQTVSLSGGTAANPTTVAANLTTKATAIDLASAGADGVDGRNTLALTGTALTTLTVTGSERVSVTAGSTTKSITTADFSGNTSGEVAFSAASSTGGVKFTAGNNKVTSLSTGEGADTITLSAENDTVTSAGDGNDTITAGAGNDTITNAGAGNDVIDLGEGNDTVSDAGDGNDSITGGAGNDTVTTAGAGDDTLDGGDGNDVLNGGAGNDSIVGGAGNDTIDDGAGNDVVLGGDGVDTITIGAGVDSVDGGAGNDNITITGLNVGDTITGGEGTDSLTVINSSAATIIPTFTSIESLTVKTSSNFTLDLTDATDKTSLKSYNVTSTDSGAADAIVLTNIASGSTVTVSDDNSRDGTTGVADDTGNITNVTIDTVGAGTLTLSVAANKDGVNDAATELGALSITDANTVTVNTSGGNSSNRIQHTATGTSLDDTDTVSLTVTAAANAGINLGNLTNAAAVETLTVSSGANAQTVLGTLTGTALQTLSVKSSGTDSSASVSTITGSQIGSLTAEAASGSATTLGAITATTGSAATAVSLQSLGANSNLQHAAVNLGTRTVESLTYKVDTNSTIGGGAVSVTSGAVAASTFTFADFATVSDGAGGADVTTFTGAQTALGMTIGRNVTFTDTIAFSGEVTKLTLTTNAATAAVAWSNTNDLTVGGAAAVAFGDTAALVAEVSLTQSGTGAVTYDGTRVGKSSVTGNIGNDALTGGAGNDTLSGGVGADTLLGAAGDDRLTAGEGADSVLGGAGNDSITLTETTSAADVAGLTNGVAAKAGTAGTGVGDDTGADTITGFDAGVDTLQIIATGVTSYTHGTNSGFGSGATTGTATSADGAFTEFASTAFLLDFDFAASNKINTAGVDMAINMTSLTVNGAAASSLAAGAAETALEARLQYNLTGTDAANTMVGGDLADVLNGGDGADTITGGAGADTITGGAGADVISLGTGSDTVVLANTGAANGLDTVTTFTAGALAGGGDVLDVNAFLAAGATLKNGNVGGVLTAVTAAAAATEGTSIAIDNQLVVIKVADLTTVDTAAELATALADGGVLDAIDIAAGKIGTLVLAADGGTSAIVVYINNATGDAVAEAEISVVANMTTSADFVDTLLAANFAIV